MAGQGPAPAENRRRRNTPERGEWVDLPELDKPILPSLPQRAKGTGSWSPRSKQAWAAWRADSVTTQYSVADIQGAIDLIYLYEEWVRGGDVAAEIRQRQDRLGLNPKGRRDLRWRAPQEQPGDAKPKPKRAKSANSRRAHLTAVK